MNKKMIVLTFKAIGAIGGIAGFVWLFMYDRKLAIAVFFILWGNNVSTKDTEQQVQPDPSDSLT